MFALWIYNEKIVPNLIKRIKAAVTYNCKLNTVVVYFFVSGIFQIATILVCITFYSKIKQVRIRI